MVCLLIDSRRAPSELDMEQFRLLYSLGFNPLIVATKTDKLKKNEKKKNIAAIRSSFYDEIVRLQNMKSEPLSDDPEAGDVEIPVIAFSSTTGEGKDELMSYISMIL